MTNPLQQVGTVPLPPVSGYMDSMQGNPSGGESPTAGIAPLPPISGYMDSIKGTHRSRITYKGTHRVANPLQQVTVPLPPVSPGVAGGELARPALGMVP